MLHLKDTLFVCSPLLTFVSSVACVRGGCTILTIIILDHHGVVIKFQRSKYAASTGSLRLQVE